MSIDLKLEPRQAEFLVEHLKTMVDTYDSYISGTVIDSYRFHGEAQAAFLDKLKEYKLNYQIILKTTLEAINND